MGCIYFVRTEHSSRRDHTDRKLALFHHTCLYRRCLGTKYDIFINVKCILLVFCRMIFRDVQFLEVVQVIFYFRSFYHFIAHTDEDSLHLFQSDSVRMTVSYHIFLRWKCNVNDFFLHLLFADCTLHLYFSFFHYFLNGFSRLIDHLTDFWSVFRCNIFHSFKHCCQFTFFTKVFYTHIVQLLWKICLFNRF